MSADLDQKDEREREVRGAFSPSTPVRSRDLFAGRIPQLLRLQEGIDEPGQHVVIYGERGVGKTSLAAVSAILVGGQPFAQRVNCTVGDDFTTVWRRAFNEVRIRTAVPGMGFIQPIQEKITSAADYFQALDELTPDHVRVGLTMLSEAATRNLVFYFDEFDRVTNGEVHRLFADTIKTLSDQVVDATIVLVGVADNVDELIVEHASVERALVQIPMPRMSFDELAKIVTVGLQTVDMTIEPDALSRITSLSQGLPHYTHLLAQNAAASAVWSDTPLVVDVDDVRAAIQVALEKAQESLSSTYYAGTSSNRENIYKEVVLAAACAKVDDRGYFAAGDVRGPLSKILGRPMDIPAFAGHLNALSTDRGPMLRKEGTSKKFRYRFLNPLMQPYVVMKGLDDLQITHDDLESLQQA